jgi:hypothetical protein
VVTDPSGPFRCPKKGCAPKLLLLDDDPEDPEYWLRRTSDTRIGVSREGPGRNEVPGSPSYRCGDCGSTFRFVEQRVGIPEDEFDEFLPPRKPDRPGGF